MVVTPRHGIGHEIGEAVCAGRSLPAWTPRVVLESMLGIKPETASHLPRLASTRRGRFQGVKIALDVHFYLFLSIYLHF